MRLASRKSPLLVVLLFLLLPSISLANPKVYLTSCCGQRRHGFDCR